MIRRPPRSTQSRSSAASDVYKRQAPPATIYVVRPPCRRRSHRISPRLRQPPSRQPLPPSANPRRQMRAALPSSSRPHHSSAARLMPCPRHRPSPPNQRLALVIDPRHQISATTMPPDRRLALIIDPHRQISTALPTPQQSNLVINTTVSPPRRRRFALVINTTAARLRHQHHSLRVRRSSPPSTGRHRLVCAATTSRSQPKLITTYWGTNDSDLSHF